MLSLADSQVRLPVARKQGEAGDFEDKVTSEFMKLVDYMED